MSITNTFINVANFALIMTSSLVLSSGFVAHFLWAPMMRRIRRFENWEKTQLGIMGSRLWTREFQNRYQIEDEITHTDKKNYMKTITPTANFIVTEATPQGLVYMGHDSDGFIYWSDRSIPHSTLDVIARKYCLNSGHLKLYINKDIETEDDKTEKPAINDDIFVKPKNKPNNKTSIKINEKDLNTRNYYKHRGKIQEYHSRQTTQAPKAKKMSFQEWQNVRARQFKKEE